MRARTYINNNFELHYRNRLLRGIGLYLRRKGKKTLDEYEVEDLISDYKDDVLTDMWGIGSKTIQRLKSQLKADEYL